MGEGILEKQVDEGVYRECVRERCVRGKVQKGRGEIKKDFVQIGNWV
jgi:hypothetical protein